MQESNPFVSGLGFFGHGFEAANDQMPRATCELRSFIDWLEEKCNVSKVRMTDMSPGGWTTARLASLKDQPQFASSSSSIEDHFNREAG